MPRERLRKPTTYSKPVATAPAAPAAPEAPRRERADGRSHAPGTNPISANQQARRDRAGSTTGLSGSDSSESAANTTTGTAGSGSRPATSHGQVGGGSTEGRRGRLRKV